MNDKLQLAEVETARRRDRATELMRTGVTIVDPARVDIRGEVHCGRDVEIEINVILEGKVQLGDRARIGPGCVLRDCEIGADTEVRANCVIEGATTGARCVVGPFARLRPGTRLADEVHVGNFVEVKNTELGRGSKANHLTYLGDATIGANVNVGAGTVTCNYDGANKHRTTIGDGAFIGSGAMLVAPVTRRRGSDDRCRLDDHQAGTSRQVDSGALPAADFGQLEASVEKTRLATAGWNPKQTRHRWIPKPRSNRAMATYMPGWCLDSRSRRSA